jgi:hypothetical protein
MIGQSDTQNINRAGLLMDWKLMLEIARDMSLSKQSRQWTKQWAQHIEEALNVQRT